MNTVGSTTEVPSTPDKKEYLQELLSEFEKLGTSKNIDFHFPHVTTTQEGF